MLVHPYLSFCKRRFPKQHINELQKNHVYVNKNQEKKRKLLLVKKNIEKQEPKKLLMEERNVQVNVDTPSYYFYMFNI
jgi:hypothetical protein